MLSYTGKRLLQTIFVLLGISLITFVLLQVVPGDPVALMLEKRADPETIAKVRKELGLDLPYYVQYLNFIKGAIHLDFGTSYFTKEIVTDALFRCFKVTVKLACMSFIFASVIGIPSIRRHLTYFRVLRWVRVTQEILRESPEPVCWKYWDRITSVPRRQRVPCAGPLS